LCHAHALAHVKEYVQLAHALALNIFAAPSVETITAFRHFHPLAEVDLPPFVDNCHPKMDLVLDRKAFIFALTHSQRFSFDGILDMVYELLWDCFVVDDYASGFDFFLRYVDISFVVMFLHQYHAYLLHCNYWLWRNKSKTF
jgi:hypothetical protein